MDEDELADEMAAFEAEMQEEDAQQMDLNMPAAPQASQQQQQAAAAAMFPEAPVGNLAMDDELAMLEGMMM